MQERVGERRLDVEAWTKAAHRAYLVALRATGNPALAEEAVQETFAKLLARPPAARGEPESLSYFLTAVRGTAIDLARSDRSRKRREEEHAMTHSESAQSPEDAREASESAVAARAALAELPREEREAVSLCCEQDLSRRDASSILGVPERTLGDRLQRGLEKLQRVLAAQGMAAATPLAIGEGLRGLGVPPAPESLTVAMTRIAGSVAKASARIARRGVSRSGVSPAYLVVAVAAAAGAGAWLYSHSTPPVNPGATPPAAPVPESRLHVRWNFAEGPFAEMRSFQGAWTWSRPDAKAPGFMSTASDQWAFVALPTRVPAGPVLISTRFLWKGPKNRAHFLGAGWLEDGKPAQKFARWHGQTDRLEPGSYIQRVYLLDRHLIHAVGDTVSSVKEYPKAYSNEQIYLNFMNLDVLEIEIRALKSEEVPAAYRDPAQWLKKAGWTRDSVDQEAEK